MITESKEPFVFPDLRTWQPLAKEVPAGLRAGALKAALRKQDLSLDDPTFRRDLIVRLALGGMGERPYGDKDSSIYFRQTIGQDSAQSRARLLSVLFEAEKSDTTAPVVDARTAAAVHFMALAYYGDVDWETVRTHKDFTGMLEESYHRFDGVRIEALGRNTHHAEVLDAGRALLLENIEKETIPNPSYIAAKMVARSYSRGPMHEVDASGVRRVWPWLNLVMWREALAGNPDPNRRSNTGRQALSFLLGVSSSRHKWYAPLGELTFNPQADARGSATLRRFLENDSSKDAETHAFLAHIVERIDSMSRAYDREARTPSLNKEDLSPGRRQKYRP